MEFQIRKIKPEDSKKSKKDYYSFDRGSRTFDYYLDPSSPSSSKKHKQERKPLECEICGSTFTQNRSLKSHMNIHTKPFKCEICNSAFSSKIYLKNHLAAHTGQRPYRCVICNSGFPQESYLRNHMGTHTREKIKKHYATQNKSISPSM